MNFFVISLISYQTLCFLNSENLLLRLITKKVGKRKLRRQLSTLRRNFIFREIYLQPKCAEKTCSVCFWSVIMIQQNFYFCINAKRLFCLRLYQKKRHKNNNNKVACACLPLETHQERRELLI